MIIIVKNILELCKVFKSAGIDKEEDKIASSKVIMVVFLISMIILMLCT